MKRTFAAVSIIALLTLAIGPAAAAQDETENVSKTVPIAAGGKLELKNFSGRVTITASDRSDVVIEAVRTAPRERLNRILLDIQADGGNVTINANQRASSWNDDNNNVVNTRFDIQVPRKIDVKVHVFSSPVTITGVEGDYDVDSFSGSLSLTGPSGAVKAKTFSGDIDIACAPSVSKPEITANTFSGDIEVRVPANASASVDFNTFSGDLDTSLPLTLIRKSKRSLEASLNASGSRPSNELKLKTFSGDVTIR